ncbi:MAG: N-acetyltransferase family protein [Steroidobacteraceae bacterium]
MQPERDSPSPVVTVGAMTEAHWPEVRAIYQVGIDTGHATFASSAPATWAAWQQDHLKELSLVALKDGTVVGWAALAPVSERCVYAGVAEVSVYVAARSQGQGVGRELLSALIERSEARDIWTLQAGIFTENAASAALHQALGFELVGLRRRIGKMSYGPFSGQWRDVLLFERRSNRIGSS